MENTVTIRLDLGINAQKFIQEVQLNNKTIEDQIAKGIELALNDITEGDNFIQAIRANTKLELTKTVNTVVSSWSVQNKISKLIEEKVGKQIEAYAEQIAESVTRNLK